MDAVQPARAVENFAFVVAANQGASAENYPPFSWPGGSMIVDFDGRILAQADPGPGEKIVVGPIDLAALRAERQRRRGHHLLSHLRAEAYTELYTRPIYRPGGRPCVSRTASSPARPSARGSFVCPIHSRRASVGIHSS